MILMAQFAALLHVSLGGTRFFSCIFIDFVSFDIYHGKDLFVVWPITHSDANYFIKLHLF